MTTADRIAQALRPEAPHGWLADEEVPLIDQLAALWDKRACPPSSFEDDPLTCRVALELIGHEAIVQEAYRDSVGVWTWGVGVTDASGHLVQRYVDNPQPIERCLEIYVWLLRNRYIPPVLKAFTRPLTEAQFAAALSFHYNTGRIASADWVKSWNVGHDEVAREEIMNWRTPASIVERREKERDLFFDGVWSQDGCATVYPVRKPSYRPHFAAGKRIDVSEPLGRLLEAGE